MRLRYIAHANLCMYEEHSLLLNDYGFGGLIIVLLQNRASFYCYNVIGIYDVHTVLLLRKKLPIDFKCRNKIPDLNYPIIISAPGIVNDAVY